jgi:hypothetical protein
MAKRQSLKAEAELGALHRPRNRREMPLWMRGRNRFCKLQSTNNSFKGVGD